MKKRSRAKEKGPEAGSHPVYGAQSTGSEGSLIDEPALQNGPTRPTFSEFVEELNKRFNGK